MGADSYGSISSRVKQQVQWLLRNSSFLIWGNNVFEVVLYISNICFLVLAFLYLPHSNMFKIYSLSFRDWTCTYCRVVQVFFYSQKLSAECSTILTCKWVLVYLYYSQIELVAGEPFFLQVMHKSVWQHFKSSCLFNITFFKIYWVCSNLLCQISENEIVHTRIWLYLLV